jgi:hypothetical protein
LTIEFQQRRSGGSAELQQFDCQSCAHLSDAISLFPFIGCGDEDLDV